MNGVLDGLEILPESLSGNRLIADYYEGSPRLGPFYAGYPWSISAFRRRVEHLKRRSMAERQFVLREAIQPSTPRAAEKLERIAAGDGFVITTGQQAGLLGGPLYTSYKILTAVKLARELENALRVPVAPLFWVPADDHDWEEVNHLVLVDARNQLQRVELPDTAETAVSMARRKVGDAIAATIEQVAALLPRNEFSSRQLELLQRTYTPDASVAEAFQNWIAHTFAPFDLLTVSSSHSAIKRFSAPLLQRELDNTEQHAALLRAQTDRLLAAGYPEQVPIAPDAANVMYEDELGRERLVREQDGWVLRRTKRTFTDQELRAELEQQPERFSPNVLLRPVVEGYTFPTLAYVGGPSELGYFAQTGCLYAAHDVPMQLFYPRMSVELVEAKIRKVLDKFELRPADLRHPFHELASQFARDELPENVKQGLFQLRQSITDGYGALAEATQGIDATLRGPMESARNSSHKHVDDAERKILQHLKKQNEVGLEQLRKASTNLFPDGQRQERVISILNYLARYGESFLGGILAAYDVTMDAQVEGWDGVRCA